MSADIDSAAGPGLDALLAAPWRLVHLTRKGGGEPGFDPPPGDRNRIRFATDGTGELTLGGQAFALSCTPERKGGRPAAAFRWEAAERGAGEGAAELRGDLQLRGTLRFDSGPTLRFVAEREGNPASDFAGTLLPLPPTFLPPDRYRLVRKALEDQLRPLAHKVTRPRWKDAMAACRMSGEVRSDQQEHCLLDIAMFSLPAEGPTMATIHSMQVDPRESREMADVRAALGRHRLTLVRVTALEEGRGVFVDDLIYGGNWPVTDRGMSVSFRPGDTLAMRLLRLDDGVVCTGAALPLPSEFFDGMDSALTELLAENARAHGNERVRNKLAALLVSMGLAVGGDRHVRLLGDEPEAGDARDR